MILIDDILFNGEIPAFYEIGYLRNKLKDKYGDIKCFTLRERLAAPYHSSDDLRKHIFTKFGYFSGSLNNSENFIEMKFSYSFLFGIHCTQNDQFNLDLYNKYKDLIKDADEKVITEEKDAIIRQKDLLIADLQQKYLELNNKYSELENKYQNLGKETRYIDLEEEFIKEQKKSYKLEIQLEQEKIKNKVLFESYKIYQKLFTKEQQKCKKYYDEGKKYYNKYKELKEENNELTDDYDKLFKENDELTDKNNDVIKDYNKLVDSYNKLKKTINIKNARLSVLDYNIKKLAIENINLTTAKNRTQINKDCLICYDKTETYYICRPCNHVMSIHANCLLRATRCPICNQATTTREQVYLS